MEYTHIKQLEELPLIKPRHAKTGRLLFNCARAWQQGSRTGNGAKTYLTHSITPTAFRRVLGLLDMRKAFGGCWFLPSPVVFLRGTGSRLEQVPTLPHALQQRARATRVLSETSMELFPLALCEVISEQTKRTPIHLCSPILRYPMYR